MKSHPRDLHFKVIPAKRIVKIVWEFYLEIDLQKDSSLII